MSSNIKIDPSTIYVLIYERKVVENENCKDTIVDKDPRFS